MHTLPSGLQGLTRVVRVLTVLGAVVTMAVPPLFWLQDDWVRETGPQVAGLAAGTSIVVDARAQWLGALGSLPAVVLSLVALWQLWRLFGAYAAGRFFTHDAQTPLRRFAWCMLAAAVVVPLQRAAVGVALTLGNPPGERVLLIGFSSNDYFALLIGAVLLAVATVQTEAARLAEENEGFV